jgi:hypothetical protein
VCARCFSRARLEPLALCLSPWKVPSFFFFDEKKAEANHFLFFASFCFLDLIELGIGNT